MFGLPKFRRQLYSRDIFKISIKSNSVSTLFARDFDTNKLFSLAWTEGGRHERSSMLAKEKYFEKVALPLR